MVKSSRQAYHPTHFPIDMGKPQSIDTLIFFNTHGFSISFSHKINTDRFPMKSVEGAVTGSEPHQEDLGIRRDRLHTEASISG